MRQLATNDLHASVFPEPILESGERERSIERPTWIVVVVQVDGYRARMDTLSASIFNPS